MINPSLSESERRVFRRYAELALPRHTSYPIAPVWSSKYGPGDFRQDLTCSREKQHLLSVYVHIPYCERLCYYCACTKEIVPLERRRRVDPADNYLNSLEREAARIASAVGPGEVQQIHLGGGSPTFLTPAQLTRLWQILKTHFAIVEGAEVAVELDPRVTTSEHLHVLRSLGFNRVSLGIQDFEVEVQRAVNRVQSFELVQKVVDECRALRFASVNFDLIYGLPFQTLESMAATLDKTMALGPDRIAFYRLALIPEMFSWQNTFSRRQLPGGDLLLELDLLAIDRFQQAGYEFIGLDHFARPDEALARARRDSSLRRTFQGMTTGKGLDILGLGPSAISQLDGAYAQNWKSSREWQQALTQDLATQRGMRLSHDDRLRRELMQQLYGQGIIDKRQLEKQFDVVFDNYFDAELEHVEELVEEGLLKTTNDKIQVTNPLGRLLIRVVAAAFDRYLPAGSFRHGLPETLASKVG